MRKGIYPYPYDYMDDSLKFNESVLSTKDASQSILDEIKISDEDNLCEMYMQRIQR